MKKKIFLIMLVCSLIIVNISVSADPLNEDPNKTTGDCRIRVVGPQGGPVEINIVITLVGDDNSTKVINISLPLQPPADSKTAASYIANYLNTQYHDLFYAEANLTLCGVEGLYYCIVDFKVMPQSSGPQYKCTKISVSSNGEKTKVGGGAAIDPTPPNGYVYLNIYGNTSSGYVEVWVDNNWAVVHTIGKTINQVKTEIVEELLDGGIPAKINDNGEIFIKPMNADTGVWIGSTDVELNVESTLCLIVAPNKPVKPEGPSELKKNVEYNFTTTTIDLDNDKIQYGWDWNGDKQVDEWTDFVESGKSIITKHSWSEGDSYNIYVNSKDEYGFISEWSDPLEITLLKNKPYFFNMIEQLLFRFPFFEKILKQYL